jgi:hypothetical protein
MTEKRGEKQEVTLLQQGGKLSEHTKSLTRISLQRPLILARTVDWVETSLSTLPEMILPTFLHCQIYGTEKRKPQEDETPCQ